MITFTNSAATKIAELVTEENNPELKLRVSVQGGGCSGFSYAFSFDDTTNEDDFVIARAGVTVLVDAMSSQYLSGAEIDYRDDLMGSSFAINNPQAETTCGCGSSFSMNDDYFSDNDHFSSHEF